MVKFPGKQCWHIPCRGVLHIVEEGDTLYKIAKKYGVPLSKVMYANPYINVYNLQVGDEICVPVMAPRPLSDGEFSTEMNPPYPSAGTRRSEDRQIPPIEQVPPGDRQMPFMEERPSGMRTLPGGMMRPGDGQMPPMEQTRPEGMRTMPGGMMQPGNGQMPPMEQTQPSDIQTMPMDDGARSSGRQMPADGRTMQPDGMPQTVRGDYLGRIQSVGEAHGEAEWPAVTEPPVQNDRMEAEEGSFLPNEGPMQEDACLVNADAGMEKGCSEDGKADQEREVYQAETEGCLRQQCIPTAMGPSSRSAHMPWEAQQVSRPLMQEYLMGMPGRRPVQPEL